METALTELCQEIRNWFDRTRYIGHITLDADGGVFCNGVAVGLLEGQYYRVIGSVFSDCIHQHPDIGTREESFDGAVWALAIPEPVINLAMEIAEWRGKYEAVDSFAMSPFTSESVGSYSRSKGAMSAGSGASNAANWQSVFAARMNAWRKIL